MISGVLARYLQSWDISINNSFKDELRKKSIEQEEGSTQVSRGDSINWVWEVWYSDRLSRKWWRNNSNQQELLWI